MKSFFVVISKAIHFVGVMEARLMDPPFGSNSTIYESVESAEDAIATFAPDSGERFEVWELGGQEWRDLVARTPRPFLQFLMGAESEANYLLQRAGLPKRDWSTPTPPPELSDELKDLLMDRLGVKERYAYSWMGWRLKTPEHPDICHAKHSQGYYKLYIPRSVAGEKRELSDKKRYELYTNLQDLWDARGAQILEDHERCLAREVREQSGEARRFYLAGQKPPACAWGAVYNGHYIGRSYMQDVFFDAHGFKEFSDSMSMAVELSTSAIHRAWFNALWRFVPPFRERFADLHEQPDVPFSADRCLKILNLQHTYLQQQLEKYNAAA